MEGGVPWPLLHPRCRPLDLTIGLCSPDTAAVTEVLRYAAFTATPSGGNPAGVVLDSAALDDAAMQRIATEVGYSETAFLREQGGRRFAVRYFSPAAEVPFCGHATIASAVALAERDGTGELHFATPAGEVQVSTGSAGGLLTATLTSVRPAIEPVTAGTLTAALAALRWRRDDLEAALPPRTASAGARHLVLAAASRDRLARLDYDFDGLRALMLEQRWTTVHLVWRESRLVHHARDPFAVGGVVEDPATGAAAAAYGAYLRELGLAGAGDNLTIHQGDDMGRPSVLQVEVTPAPDGIRVTGGAVRIPAG